MRELWDKIYAGVPPHVGAVIVDPRDDRETMRKKLDGVYIYDHLIYPPPSHVWASLSDLMESGVIDGVTIRAKCSGDR